MDRGEIFGRAKILFTFFVAFAALAGLAHGQTTRTPPGSSPATSPYTATVNCPDANGLVVDITASTLPAGWTATHTQLELRTVDAGPSQYPSGKQALACHYKAKDCAGCSGGQDTLILKRVVELGSCMNSVPGQPKKSFQCKPGAIK